VVASLREHGVFAPVLLAQCTTYEMGPRPHSNHEVVRQAQRALVDPGGGMLAGPDLNSIRTDMRSEGSRSVEACLTEHARAWFDVLVAKRHLLNKP
jgi:hypothetical protein